MPIYARKAQRDFELPSEGWHAARLAKVEDLGVPEWTTDDREKIRLTWIIDEPDNGQPLEVSHVCETNFGADLVLSVLKQADSSVRTKKVTATRGKTVRAAPIALKYERGEVHHMAGADLEQLEDELVLFTDDGQPIDPSPDRADACIWALSALLDDRRSRIAILGGPVILSGSSEKPAPVTSELLAATGAGVRQPGLLMQPLSIATSCGFSVESPHPDGHHRTACLMDLVFNAHPSTLRGGRNA